MPRALLAFVSGSGSPQLVFHTRPRAALAPRRAPIPHGAHQLLGRPRAAPALNSFVSWFRSLSLPNWASFFRNMESNHGAAAAWLQHFRATPTANWLGPTMGRPWARPLALLWERTVDRGRTWPVGNSSTIN
jgi:hypothetical protein